MADKSDNDESSINNRWMWYYLRRDESTEYDICNICNKACTRSHKHLTKKHKLNKDIANELKIWVNDQLLLIKECESCDQFKESDIFNKMIHLVQAHRVIVLPKFIPTGLKDCTWMWYYLRSDTENEICNICNKDYIIAHRCSMNLHVSRHPNLYNRLEIHNNFTPTETNGVKCNYCSQIYMPFLNPSKKMHSHLTNIHELNKDIANELKIWVNDQLLLIKKCESCDQFKESDIFNKMIHLVQAHRVIVLPKFIPTDLKDCTWMWYYLRSDTENEICNICNKEYIIAHRFSIIAHGSTSHPRSYNPLEKHNNFTPTETNGVKCNYCSQIYMPFLNPSTNMQKHLTSKHELNENIANELKIWVNQQLDIIKKCDICDQFKESDIFNKMVHLVEAHRVIVLPKFIPTGLEDCTWMWYYLRSDTENEICNICNKEYIIAHRCSMNLHVSKSHPNLYNRLEIHNNSTPTETNGVKCNYCSQIYMPFLNPSTNMQKHLTSKHELNENIANELKIWVNQQLDIIKKCDICDQFKESDIFNKMVHLVEAHRVIVLPKFIPTGVTEIVLNLFHGDGNNVDSSTLSSNQQPTCNTSRTDVENVDSDLNTDRTVESTEKYNWTEYMHISPSTSFSSYGDTDKYMSDVKERNTADIPTSSSNQLPTCSTLRTDVENVGSDLNPDETVEFTEEDIWADYIHIAPSADSEEIDSIYNIEVDKLFGCNGEKSHPMSFYE
ncbi:uncharacterized protein LOC114933416 isoform X3 [Nylanderia fulva]|uniref:uncharacterized protein LOC114933416 isoform X3 n=2 Tax=Nylanderia fulva TaxID=613905 RepID=UPI0010FBBC55|nr:uncharacterized protein LOC114933416 isoform X3 [Nylanderia fulva]